MRIHRCPSNRTRSPVCFECRQLLPTAVVVAVAAASAVADPAVLAAVEAAIWAAPRLTAGMQAPVLMCIGHGEPTFLAYLRHLDAPYAARDPHRQTSRRIRLIHRRPRIALSSSPAGTGSNDCCRRRWARTRRTPAATGRKAILGQLRHSHG